jgi:hypothetical protein
MPLAVLRDDYRCVLNILQGEWLRWLDSSPQVPWCR